MADGQATKIIVPSEIANLSGTLTALSETVRTGNPVHQTQSHAAQAPKSAAQKPQAPKQAAGIIDRIIGD